MLKFIPFLFDSFSKAYVQDPDFREVYEKLSSSRSKYEGLDEFHLQNRLLYHFNALCVPVDERIGLIRESHTSNISRYFGVGKTLYNLQRYVYWPKMQD